MKKQSFAVIGLGHFGAIVVRNLYEAGKDILALDMNREAVRDAAEFARKAVTADATDREALEALGIADVDVAIVSLGERLDVITLAALHLREMGVPHIAVKALSEEHCRILAALGVQEIIHPEKDAAIRLAKRMAGQDLVDFLPLVAGYSIVEVNAPEEFVGKSLRDLSIRNHLKVQLVAIQRGEGERKHINIVPRADDVIQEDDLLILIGENNDLERIRDIVKKKA